MTGTLAVTENYYYAAAKKGEHTNSAKSLCLAFLAQKKRMNCNYF